LAEVGAGDGEAVGSPGDGRDLGVGDDLDAVAGQLGVDEGTEFWVEGREHFGAALQLGDLNAADGESFGHFEADVAGADDDRGARGALVEVAVEGEGVAHRVENVDAVVGAKFVETGDPS
jgi:hypothetical protein